MLLILLALIPGALAGAVASVLTTRRLLSRQRRNAFAPLDEPADPFISAELDQAAAKWATDNGQPPQAASLMADKLHLLHHLGSRRGQQP